MDDRIWSRGYLPHWERPGSTYFITWREAGSLPREVIARLADEHAAIKRTFGETPNAVQRSQIQRAFFNRYDAALHDHQGRCRVALIADVIAANLQHFAGRRYDLLAWCVMPNHVHVVMRPYDGERIDSLVHSWKSYTAHVSGEKKLWAREYFDRILRKESEIARTIEYVRANPSKARLENWKWVG